MGVLIESYDRLKKLGEELQAQSLSIVATNGCFDILHVGHVNYLQAAKAFGDVLVVGVNSDQSVKSLKGQERPLNTAINRIKILNALSCVNYTFIFEGKTADPFLVALRPNSYVKGGDYRPELLPEYETLQKMKSVIQIVRFEDGFSSTNLINKLRDHMTD